MKKDQAEHIAFQLRRQGYDPEVLWHPHAEEYAVLVFTGPESYDEPDGAISTLTWVWFRLDKTVYTNEANQAVVTYH